MILSKLCSVCSDKGDKMHGNRIKLRQQLEKEKLENERRREEGELMMRREAIVTQSSSTMEVPQRHQLPQISVEVPQNVLEVYIINSSCLIFAFIILKVRSKLQNPTSFHIASVRKNQLHQFLSTQSTSMGSQSAPPPGTNQIFCGNSSGGGNNGSQHIGGGISSFSAQKDPLLSSGLNNDIHVIIHVHVIDNNNSKDYLFQCNSNSNIQSQC